VSGLGPAAAILPVVAVATPLLLAFLVAARPPAGRWLYLVAPLPALAASLMLPAGAAVEIPWLLFGARFGLDDTGRVLLFAAAAVWLAAGLYASGSSGLRGRAAQAGFLLAMAGHFAAVLAQDAVSFFTGYALMSFAAYPLVVAAGDAAARRAGRVYIALVVLGEVLVLSGLLLLAGAAEGATATAGVLLWLGFGIKLGLVPLHAGLPLAYGAAPTAAVIALAGAMVNAGLLGWLRFLPLGDPASAGLGLMMIAVGLVGAFYGALVGITQRSPRVLLGYSSVSQMGLAAVGVGAGLVVPAAWPALLAAVLFHAVQHGIAKAALFAGLGIVATRRSRVAWALLLLPALALAGLPFTGGALAKAALKDGLPALPGAWPAILDVALPLAAVGTTLLMARLLVLTRPAAGEAASADARWLCYGALLLGVLTVGWWLPRAFGLALPSFPAPGLSAVWPAALGVALAVAVLLAHRAGAMRLRIYIPAGDVLVPVERLAGALWRRAQPVPEPHEHAEVPAPAAPGRAAVTLDKGEALLARWEFAVLLVLALALFVLGALLGAGT